jgi:hypothetical protein
MRRRTFLATVSGGLLTAPLAAGAQEAGKMWRIGLFHVGLDHIPPSLDGLRDVADVVAGLPKVPCTWAITHARGSVR